jgi:hypothetical protein
MVQDTATRPPLPPSSRLAGTGSRQTPPSRYSGSCRKQWCGVNPASDIRQREHRGRGGRLGVAVVQLAARPLKLPGNVHLGRVELDVRPGEAEHFAAAQAEHEDQDVGRVERVTVAPGRLEEPARFLC